MDAGQHWLDVFDGFRHHIHIDAGGALIAVKGVKRVHRFIVRQVRILVVSHIQPPNGPAKSLLDNASEFRSDVLDWIRADQVIDLRVRALDASPEFRRNPIAFTAQQCASVFASDFGCNHHVRHRTGRLAPRQRPSW